MIIVTIVYTMMLDDFLIRTLFAGLGLALITSPMGCFLVWRRMAFFGDALSHSTLLGVSIGFLFHVDPYWGVLFTCLIVALILGLSNSRLGLPLDSWLAILSYGALALGAILMSKLDIRVDPSSYLFGDILALRTQDLYWIYACALIVGIFIYCRWRPLLLLTIDESLAQAEGTSVKTLSLAFMLVLAAAVAVSLKFLGALLVPALLVIPPAIARYHSHTPESMVAKTFLATIISIIAGISFAFYSNIAAGPSIILIALMMFLFCGIIHKLK